MKRDCGNGELIPIKWVVVSVVGQTGDKHEQKFLTKDFAESAYRAKTEITLLNECSSSILYAKDKQGYMNCIKSTIHCKGGQINESDRSNELK